VRAVDVNLSPLAMGPTLLLMFSPRDSLALSTRRYLEATPLPLLSIRNCTYIYIHTYIYTFICLYIILLIKPVAIVLANERSHLPLTPCSSPAGQSTTSSVRRRDGRAGVRVHDGCAYVGGGAEGATAVGADAHDTR
jgi:hypothetical protein